MSDRLPPESQSSPTGPDKEFYTLLEQLCTDAISPADLERLQDRMRTCPDSRRAYRRYLGMHGHLRRIFAPEAQVHRTDLAPAMIGRFVGPRGVGSPKRWMAIAACSVLALLVLAISWPRFESPGPSVPVAAVVAPVILAQEASASFFGRQTPAIGSEIPAGEEFSLSRGDVELVFPQGARVILNGPAIFKVDSPQRLYVYYGHCSVHAPEGAQGFEVQTPAARVIDLGTRFSVNVNEVGLSEVQVVEGAADIVPAAPGTQPAALVKAGNACRYSQALGARPEVIPFQKERYWHSLPDRIISYDGPLDAAGDIAELTTLTVQRAGRVIQYDVNELIGCDVVSIKSRDRNSLLVPWQFAGDPREIPNHDNLLTTGVINPDGAPEPTLVDPAWSGTTARSQDWTPGMVLRFHRPVVNHPGPDIVLFDLQTIVDQPEGDPFHLLPMHFTPGLKPATYRNFDISLNSPQARQVVPINLLEFSSAPQSLESQLRKPYRLLDLALRYRALAVSIDLSDLGYADGDEVTELFLQDAQDDRFRIDPVFIAGFPEPALTEAAAPTEIDKPKD